MSDPLYRISTGVEPVHVEQQGATVNQNSNLIIPSDIAAAGFYVTNANNEFVGNTAQGGFASFALVNLFTPIGTHRDMVDFVPMKRPLKRFYGNTAHSSNWQYDQGRNICQLQEIL